jgi:hypothetical protein
MASIDIVSKLNEIQADKKLLLLERLNTYMFSMKKYFQQGHELLQGLEPYMNDLTTQLNQVSTLKRGCSSFQTNPS